MILKHILFFLVSTQFLSIIICDKGPKSKSVTTLLNAKWYATPIVLEVSEYLADENQDFFWAFIDSINKLKTPLSELLNDKVRYDKIIEVAESIISENKIALLKLALSLHIYSPKVQMYDQIANDRKLPKECVAVLDLNNNFLCDLENIENYLNNDGKKSELFTIDHHYPESENNSNIAILYGEVGTPEFFQFHEALTKMAESGEVNYIIRHYTKNKSSKKLRLSGYGVELQMKSTEYKSQDDSTQPVSDDVDLQSDVEDIDDELDGFNFKQLKLRFPELTHNLTKFRQYLSSATGELSPLKAWQFQDLSLKASERVLSTPNNEAIAIMTHTAQNFPVQAKSLLRNPVPSEMRDEIKQNSEIFLAALNLQPSDTALFINGLFCDMDTTDMFALFDILLSEVRVMEGLSRIGLTSSIVPLLHLEMYSNSDSQKSFALDIRDSAIWWINDLEQDKHYYKWGSSLMEMLRPTFPGMLRSIRRNLFNLILIVDPTEISSRSLIKMAESFIIHKAPLRVGLVFVFPSEEEKDRYASALALLCAYNFITEKKDAREAMGFLTDVFASVGDENELTLPDIHMELKRKFSNYDIDDVFDEESSYDFGRQLAQDFISRAGGRTKQQALLNGVPLPAAQINAEEFEEAVLTEIMHQTPTLQKAIYKGELQDHQNVVDYLMAKPHVMPRLNARILDTENNIYLNMDGNAVKENTNLNSLLKLNTVDMTATLMEYIKYFSSEKRKEKVSLFYMTLWIVGDLNTKSGRYMLLSALNQMKSSGSFRLSFIPNADLKESDNKLNQLVLAALLTLPTNEAVDFTMKILQHVDKKNDMNSFDIPTIVKDVLPEQENNLKILRHYSQKALKFSASARGIVCDGRVIGPLDDDEQIEMEDFALLERFSASTYGDKLKAVLVKGAENRDLKLNSDMVMKIVSLLGARPQGKNRIEIPAVKENHSVVKILPRNPEKVALQLTAILDPISQGAQKLGAILDVLHKNLNCEVKIYLNAIEKHSDMPIKSFYRFVLDPELYFDVNGQLAEGPIAKFTNMPTSPLLTQNMHVPDNWLVESVKAVYDLDNIRLLNVDTVVHSEFELEYLLLEGHCFDSMGSPPRGLQVTLGTVEQPIIMDTIVMANLGYFQLKANPGAWILNLRDGRSRDMYDITSVDGVDLPSNSSDIKVLLSSFQTNIVKLRVAKKPGMMHLDLLGDDDIQPGLWNSLTSSFSKTDTDETLNIFSLASGHLYERFLRIMMLSVLKHTQTPVKFWFLKNYLSPAFKEYLPYMSKEYGFQYELVQYKWPRWLHQQSEKQRIIWGYKILFLDVLFPLSVKKIIFVDADQIVRADMMDLHNLDLGGAPYGYTPFCESRKEMDGFRFWKHGYWKNHLQGRRYHISALYVVDLKRFRRIAAGDRLRGQYQALSQDPNSLANLDQDLPNNMIHQVAIKSLPQEWLWCETWCDDNSKSRAKTIDLCNNPQTKEAKLSAAVRIVAEWTDYDNEIKALQKKIDSGYFAEHFEDRDNEDNEIYKDVHSEL